MGLLTNADRGLLVGLAARARAHPVPAEAVLGAAPLPARDRAFLSRGVTVVFSFEDRSPVGAASWVRHASISRQVAGPRGVYAGNVEPERSLVRGVLDALGFSPGVEAFPSPSVGAMVLHAVEPCPSPG